MDFHGERKKTGQWAGVFPLVMLLLMLFTGASMGFVHRGIQKRRRGPGKRLRDRLERNQHHPSALMAYDKRRDWRKDKRASGRGWSGGLRKKQKVYNLEFSEDGSGKGSSHKSSAGAVNGKRASASLRSLSPCQVQKVMRSYNVKIGVCLMGQGRSSVVIGLVIAGSGRLLSLSTNGGEALERCIEKALKDARFPSFSGKKTKSTYSLRLN